MKLWLTLLGIVLLGLLAYVASGPYRTWHAIGDAVERHDAVALSDQVDFPALRRSLKGQLVDRMVRQAGPGVQSSLLGGFALTVATGMVDGVVDVMVSPGGIGGLMQGRELWRSARDSFSDPRDQAPTSSPAEVRYRFESASRFTATTRDAQGDAIVFVLRREGLDWKLVDIRLPE